MRKMIALIAALGLSACSTGIGKLPGVNAPKSPTRSAPSPTTQTPPSAKPTAPAPRPDFRSAPVQNEAGLEGVIGVRAAALIKRFGEARIDLKEGDARKLQFLGGGCVLDIYLYPPMSGFEPAAAHVEARSSVDGSEKDRAGCIRAIERRR